MAMLVWQIRKTLWKYGYGTITLSGSSGFWTQNIRLLGAPVYTVTDAGFQREMSYTLHLLHLHRHEYRVHKPIEYKSVSLIWAALTGLFNKTETQRWIKSRCCADFFAIRQRFEWNWLAVARSQISQIIFRVCLHGGGGPQIGEVTHVAGHLSCKHDQIKMGDYMDRWDTSPFPGVPHLHVNRPSRYDEKRCTQINSL